MNTIFNKALRRFKKPEEKPLVQSQSRLDDEHRYSYSLPKVHSTQDTSTLFNSISPTSYVTSFNTFSRASATTATTFTSTFSNTTPPLENDSYMLNSYITNDLGDLTPSKSNFRVVNKTPSIDMKSLESRELLFPEEEKVLVEVEPTDHMIQRKPTPFVYKSLSPSDTENHIGSKDQETSIKLIHSEKEEIEKLKKILKIQKKQLDYLLSRSIDSYNVPLEGYPVKESTCYDSIDEYYPTKELLLTSAYPDSNHKKNKKIKSKLREAEMNITKPIRVRSNRRKSDYSYSNIHSNSNSQSNIHSNPNSQSNIHSNSNSQSNSYLNPHSFVYYLYPYPSFGSTSSSQATYLSDYHCYHENKAYYLQRYQQEQQEYSYVRDPYFYHH